MKRSKILNKIGVIFVACLLISLSPQVVIAATYYSDFATGLDTNNGTSTSTPWKHMPGMSGWTGSATLSSGDVVVLKGGSHWTFTTAQMNTGYLITPPTPITIMGGQQCGFTGSPAVACDGTTTPCGSTASVSCNGGAAWGSGYPIIDGTGNVSGNTLYGIYAGNGLSGALIVDGLELYNITEASSGTGFGLQLAYGSNSTNNNTFTALEVKNSLFDTYAVDGISVYNDTNNKTLNHILIHDNVFEAQGRNDIESCLQNGCTSAVLNDIQIYNNTVYGSNTSGKVFTGGSVDAVDKFHNDAFMIAGANANAVYGITGLVIHHNKFIGDWCAYNGQDSTSSTAVLYLSGNTSQYSESGTLIYDNLFEDDTATCANNSGTQEPPWAWGAIGIGGGYHSGDQIYNNTFYASPNYTAGEQAIMITACNNAASISIKNNIFAKCDNCVQYYENTAQSITVTDNQFWTINSNTLINNNNTTYCTTCAGCVSDSLATAGYCANSNPEFTTLPTAGTAGSGNFNLLSNSPTIGQGANLSSIFTTDITGATWTVPYGLGAYEYGAVQSTQSTLLVTSVNGTVTSNPSGINCGSTCSANYDSGTAVTLTASPNSGYTFTGWSGGGCSGTGTCTVTMTAATSVTATFATTAYNLTVTKSGTGTGTVTGSDGLINCGSTCSVNYAQGTSITLTASATSGSIFTGWSGGGCSGTGTCTATMTAATSVTATFTPVYSLTVTNSTTGEGTVTDGNGLINCGSTCSANYQAGTSVTLTASANSGYTFTGWLGGGCSGTGTCTVTMTAATSVTATFATTVYNLTVRKSGTGTGTVTGGNGLINCGSTCSVNYSSKTSVTLTASATSGSTFSGWSGACSGTRTCTVTMSAAKSATAAFAKKIH